MLSTGGCKTASGQHLGALSHLISRATLFLLGVSLKRDLHWGSLQWPGGHSKATSVGSTK